MGDFAAQWLELREPCDHAARSGRLAARFAAALGAAPTVVDLGFGSGSNLRYLSPRLGPRQSWLCFDDDPELLAAAAVAIGRWADARGLAHERPGPQMHLRGARAAVDVVLIRRDLRNIRRSLGLDQVSGLTSSAFLDLVSAAWIDALAHRLARQRLPLLVALTFDGRLEWQPRAPHDRTLVERFNRHQRTDKGFGPALGPDAAPYLGRRLARHGYEVVTAPADWHLDSLDRPLLAPFLDGFAEAVRAVADDDLVGPWLDARRAALTAGTLRLTVGHQDLLALPR